MSLLLNIGLLTAFVGKRVYYAKLSGSNSTTVNDSIVTYSYNKIKADNETVKFFRELPNDTSDIVFLGTSLTQAFPLQEMFGNVHLRNRGIGGNTSRDILNRLEEVTEGKPEKIFLEVGTNDITKGFPMDTLIHNVKKIVYMIRKETPKTSIYIQSVLPTAFGQATANPKIKEYNELIQAFCETNNIPFIDLHRAFYLDGSMNKSLTTDGIHLKGAGYYVWSNCLKKYLH